MSEVDATALEVQEPDYDYLLRENLQRLFNERDATKRAEALNELFVANPVMYEPTATVTGRTGISEVAGKLLEQFGPTFSFTPEGTAVGHHGLGSLRWQAGSAGGPVVVTGTDAAEIVDGKIARLWVLLNPSST